MKGGLRICHVRGFALALTENMTQVLISAFAPVRLVGVHRCRNRTGRSVLVDYLGRPCPRRARRVLVCSIPQEHPDI